MTLEIALSEMNEEEKKEFMIWIDLADEVWFEDSNLHPLEYKNIAKRLLYYRNFFKNYPFK